MTFDEAIILFNELSGVVGQSPIPEAVKQDIKRLYRYVTGEPLRQCNCPDLWNDAMILIQLKIRNMNDKTQTYKLKRGVVIHQSGTNQTYTRDNLTDEVAREYLDKYPNKAYLFEYIPEEQPEEEKEEKPKAKTKKRK